jgi:translation initiation factor IF-1
VREHLLEAEGVVIEHCRGGVFRVRIGSHIVVCRVASKLDRFKIKILRNDKVKVELAPPDYGRGRITYRMAVEE